MLFIAHNITFTKVNWEPRSVIVIVLVLENGFRRRQTCFVPNNEVVVGVICIVYDISVG